MITDDLRQKNLLNWLKDELEMDIKSCQPASSDASFRRYFRVKTATKQYIVMDAPPEKENINAFITVAELFSQADVNTPNIYAQNLERGFLLLEDFGSTSFLDLLAQETADNLYQSAMTSLFQLQTRLEANTTLLPQYDRALLLTELNIFNEWYLEKRLNITMPEHIRSSLHHFLIQSALEQPYICVHRDYHSRNLMVLEQNSPGVIDFQDAVIGPITYDLVSLLRDCYISWPTVLIEQWLQQYYQRLLKAGLIQVRFEQFKRWFDLMGIQRHLKAIGIFSRLKLRDNKPDYLQDIPRTMNYVLNISSNYPELNDFVRFLKHHIPIEDTVSP